MQIPQDQEKLLKWNGVENLQQIFEIYNIDINILYIYTFLRNKSVNF